MGFSIAVPCLLFIFLAAIVVGVMLTRGSRGGPSLSEPRCAKCDYDLRGFSGTAPTRCSECGADLTLRHSIQWGKQEKSPQRLWIGLAGIVSVLILLPVLLLSGRAVSSRVWSGPLSNSPGSPGFSTRSNAAVLSSLKTSANTPWDWQELQRRMAAGTLSNAEITQAIDQLIIYAKSQPASAPLTWSDTFLSSVDAAGKIPDEQYQRLSRAFYKSSSVSIPGTTRAGAKLSITVHSGGSWNLPGDERVYALRQASLNGGGVSQAVVLKSDYSAGASDPDVFSGKSFMDITARTVLDVPPGKYTLTFIIDVGVLLEKTAPQVVNSLPGQAAGWPKGRAAWTETVTVPITVVPANQSAITLITDPALDPGKTGAVHIDNIHVIRKGGTGQRATMEMSIDGKTVPCSFDVFLRISGKEYPIGMYIAWGTTRAANEHACDISLPDAMVTTADVLLRPNLKLVEGNYPIDEIWGKEVDLLNVPVQRYDLRGR